MKWFRLSKQRTIQFLISGVVYNSIFLFLLLIAEAKILLIIGLLLLINATMFGFLKISEEQDRQEHYIRKGYKQMGIIDKGENVLVNESEQALLIAVFDNKGYLLRQTRLLRKDIPLVETWLKHKNK